MGIKIGESYVILVSSNYKLADHQSIPPKYRRAVYGFWCIGSLIDGTGTVFGFLDYSYIQSICYALWEMMRCIAVMVVLHILRTIKREFSHLMTSKMQRRSNGAKSKRKKRDLKETLYPQYMSSDSTNWKEPQSGTMTAATDYETVSVTVSDHGILAMDGQRLISSAVSAVSGSGTVSVVGSVNESVCKETEEVMEYEIGRMRKLQIALYLSIIVFLMNAVFNGVLRFYEPDQFWVFEDTKTDDSIYTDTPTEIVAVVFFPQWTIINVFILMFSWIPDSRLVSSWND